MKFINLLILAIVLVLVVTISSRSVRKSKSHKKAPIPLDKFLSSGKIPHEKVANFKRLAEIAGPSCKKECTIHKATYFHIRGDAFICKCFSSWYYSKEGDKWQELPEESKSEISSHIDDEGVAILIN